MNATTSMNQSTSADPRTDWYAAGDAPELVEFGPVRALSVSGQGEPGGPEYCSAVQALYAVTGAAGLVPSPLEGRWWVEDARPWLTVPRAEWRWHLMLRLPDDTDSGRVDAAQEAVRQGMPAAYRVQYVTFTPGRCVQVMHHGSYADEPATLARMDALMEAEGLQRSGPHHEVYLSDPNVTDPAKMHTILRQPVRAGR